MEPMNDLTMDQRDLVEDWLRSAMRYGWRIGGLGFTEPDPLFDWTKGFPELIAERSGPVRDRP
jgi:hypothetical protein